ncbi:MAG: hypothetical protein ACRBBW_00555 [Cellvibrionaceae bacterium]
MIILELNEFNPDLLAKYADKLNLLAIQEVLSFTHTEITTDDTQERYGLDPWVQWVNLHTGKTKSQHNIEHLSDIHKLSESIPQIWEHVHDKYGVSFNVWGAMNASTRNQGDNCSFFPDPWTLGVDAHPNNINQLLSLPRYYAKNYLNLLQLKGLKAFLATSLYLLKPGNILNTLKLVPQAIAATLNTGLNSNLLFTLFDRLTGDLFLRHAQAGQLNILFLNSVAHLQHNYWTDEENNKDIQLCLKSLDRLLKKVLEEHPKEPLILINAFRQIQSYDKKQYLYRQKDTEEFLVKAGIKHNSIKQLMTNDAHLAFTNLDDLRFAHQQLQESTVNNKPCFHTEIDEASLNLFFQFKIWDDLPESSNMTINGRTIPFFEIYSKVVRRTGSHINVGDAFHRGVQLPEILPNHRFFENIDQHFG